MMMKLVSASTRTGRESHLQLDRLDGRYPSYFHKWARVERAYMRDDLYLPAEVGIVGRPFDAARPVIAFGGTRSPTVEAFRLCAAVAHELARAGATIISGGVPGIDLAAHMAATDVPGAPTYAILANPAKDMLFGHEWQSVGLEAAILRSGAFLSEYESREAVGSEAFAERLLSRDRIISGLSDAFVAFECSERSATVDTARRAALQGKQIFTAAATPLTHRRGLDELARELDVIAFDEKTQTPAGIAAAILARIAP